MWLNTPSVRTAWDDNSFGRLTFPTAYQNRNGAVSQVITITVNKNIFAGCPLNEFEFEATTAALTQHGINTRDFNFVGHYLPQKSPDCNWSTYFWEASFLLIFHPHPPTHKDPSSYVPPEVFTIKRITITHHYSRA